MKQSSVGTSIVLCFLSLVLLSEGAMARPLPVGACAGCGNVQQEIFQNFMDQGVGLEKIKAEAVYSGVCHWKGSYSPEDEHYAGFFWYQVPSTGEMAFKARLSYYSPKNPYTHFTPEMARKQWFARPTNLVPDVYEDYSFFDANPLGEAKHRIWYWFRQDAQIPDRLYVVAIQGFLDTGVCELNLNQSLSEAHH